MSGTISQSAGKPADWIADGEKYALIGLETKIEHTIRFRELAPELWAWTDQMLDVPSQWREWLGSVRADEIENCNLILLSKAPSRSPDVLDDENQRLQRRVWGFYIGLLLTSPFAPSHRPIMLTGSRRGNEIEVWEESALDAPFPCMFRPYPQILPQHVKQGAQLGRNYQQLATTPPNGGAWRIFRMLAVYVEARSTTQLLDRLHQYCRCIDGLILSEPGRGEKQFKSRTELFVGPRHHEMMGKIYKVRSDVEHLHEHRYLERFDRTERLELLKKEAIAEHIARHALAQILGNEPLWCHFGNSDALGRFWNLSPADRGQIWGNSVNPYDALVDFEPDYISDGQLGAC